MPGFIGSFIVGVICILLGRANMHGDISSLHSYHRHRVSEEDRLPFGRKVGMGTILCGCAVCAFSVLAALTLYTDNQLFISIGYVVLIAGLAAGLGLTLYAIRKYNKGIF